MKISYYKHDRYPDSILVRDFAGNVDVDTIIGSWNQLIKNNLLTEDLKGVINNLTECELQMDFNSFLTLMDYLKTVDILTRLKLAVICDNPKYIVFPTMGEFKEKDLRIKPFTTEESAINWILKE